MPEISRFMGIVIAMFYKDHSPPHFHARYHEYEIRVRIFGSSGIRVGPCFRVFDQTGSVEHSPGNVGDGGGSERFRRIMHAARRARIHAASGADHGAAMPLLFSKRRRDVDFA